MEKAGAQRQDWALALPARVCVVFSSFPGSAWERTAREAPPRARQSLAGTAFPGRAWEREVSTQGSQVYPSGHTAPEQLKDYANRAENCTRGLPTEMAPTAPHLTARWAAVGLRLQRPKTPMRTIHGKKALVTGAASGIGQALALSLARQGADLYLLDVDEPKLTGVVTEAKRWGGMAIGIRCDLIYPHHITAAVNTIRADWGYIDILVNNAGVAYYGPTERMTVDQWNSLLAINLLAPIQLTREWLPILLTRPEAHILNVCSIAGLVASGKLVAYHTSKYGMVGFSEALRAEYATRGLGVTALCPGFVRTSIFQAAINGRPSKPIGMPPRWLCMAPEKVATRALQAIRRNEGLVVISPMAHLLWFLKRLSPRLVARLSRSGKKRRRAKTLAKVPAVAIAKAAGSPVPPAREAALPCRNGDVSISNGGVGFGGEHP
jgi:short-subunit dehydrogenase